MSHCWGKTSGAKTLPSMMEVGSCSAKRTFKFKLLVVATVRMFHYDRMMT